jgi:hypothetical protein
MDIGSLAAAMDGNVVRLGLGRKVLRKTWGMQFFFRCTHFSIVECPVIALSKYTFSLLIAFWTLPLTLPFGTAGLLVSFAATLHQISPFHSTPCTYLHPTHSVRHCLTHSLIQPINLLETCL